MRKNRQYVPLEKNGSGNGNRTELALIKGVAMRYGMIRHCSDAGMKHSDNAKRLTSGRLAIADGTLYKIRIDKNISTTTVVEKEAAVEFAYGSYHGHTEKPSFGAAAIYRRGQMKPSFGAAAI